VKKTSTTERFRLMREQGKVLVQVHFQGEEFEWKKKEEIEKDIRLGNFVAEEVLEFYPDGNNILSRPTGEYRYRKTKQT